MPYKSSFFTAQLNNGIYDRVYNASDFTAYFDKLFSNGVVVAGGGQISTQLEVTKVTDTMKTSINLGSAFINGYQFEIYTAPTELTHATADATHTRIDRVVLELNLTDDVRAIVPKILTGTPSVNPAEPSLTQTSTVYQIPLAKISIPAGVSTLNTATLTDQREIANVKIGITVPEGDSAGVITVDDTDFTEITGTNVQDVLDSVDDKVSAIKTTADGAIPKSIIDASGDLIYGSANDTVARLAKGSDGQVLQLLSGLPSWATMSAIGTYTGNGAVDRTITVGFTPKLVILANEVHSGFFFGMHSNGKKGYSLYTSGGVTTGNLVATNSSRPNITTNGFIVSSASSVNDTNYNTDTYIWIAIA